MAPWDNTEEAKAFAQPVVRRFLKTTREGRDDQSNVCWSAKFWPYGNDDDEPTFCLSNQWDMLICRIRDAPDSVTVDVLRCFETEKLEEEIRDRKDGDPVEDQYCSCSWAYLEEDQPLLLGAGDFGYIRVFDVVKGNLMTTLVGHGKGVINELSTHPKYPWIFASASVDRSIRIWDLRRWNSKHQSPTIIICGMGNGHRESVLTIHWHDSGRYLVSGGFDNAICVWTIPDLDPESSFWDEISPANTVRREHRVRTIDYPHFMSFAIHNNYVDCVRFWGDNILSKAAEENKIVMWQVTGFKSELPPPDTLLAPKSAASEHLDTRNGFKRELVLTEDGVEKVIVKPGYKSALDYKRLLEFANPKCGPFFIRFDVLKQSAQHPNIHAMIACGDTASVVRFWDLEALELGYHPSTAANRGGRRGRGHGSRKPVPHTHHRARLNALSSLHRSESASASLPSVTGTGTGTATPSRTNSPASTDRSSVPALAAQLHPAEDASFFSDISPDSTKASDPHEDRIRFPLKYHNVPLAKANDHVEIEKGFPLIARGTAWSADGRWCVVAGESKEVVYGGTTTGKGKGTPFQVKVGAAVLLERDIPRRRSD